MTSRTVVHSAAQLARPRSGRIETVPDAAVAIEDGTVVRAGPTDDVIREYPPENAETAVDASGGTVIPGFVDPHTHAVFAGDRADEFTAKLRGRSYQELMAEGGGILRTVRAVREASLETLVSNLCEHLDTMLAHGTTTAEVKSGYGLGLDAELKLLAAIAEADDRHPVDLIATFMGAHAVPDGQEADEYVDSVIDQQLPAVADQDIATFCDVFCEAGVFSVAQSRRILEAGREHGLKLKIHAEEFERIGGAELAADLGAVSADHLLQATESDAEALATAGVTPVLLPGTAFTLDTPYADPGLFRSADADVALATDFNPNCFSQSMEFAIDLACHGMRLSPEDALLGSTAVASDALALDDGTGTVDTGAPGDIVIADVPTHEHLPYNFGVSTIETVLADGEVVYDAG